MNAFRLEEAATALNLRNIRDIRFDGVMSLVSGNTLTVKNLRILSDTTDLDDYISIDFLLDADSLQLIPGNLEIVKDLGIYQPTVKQNLFSKDVTENISMVPSNGDFMRSDIMHTLTVSADDEFAIQIETGTLLSLKIFEPTDDYELQIDEPDGGVNTRALYHQGSRYILTDYDFLHAGVYTFRFVPQNDPTVTLQFGFTNNNRTPLETISSGSSISASLSGWGYEYAKYKITLNKGDLIGVTNPSDLDVWLYLVNSNSKVIRSGNGKLYYRVSSIGEYYIFVQNTNYQYGASYSGSVQVTPDENISQYPVLSPISDQTAALNRPFSLQLNASNSPQRFTAGGLPDGILLNEATGLISGTPNVSGKFLIEIKAENEFGTDRTDFFLKVPKLNKVVVIPLFKTKANNSIPSNECSEDSECANGWICSSGTCKPNIK
ncbi:MAG: hypothetical protein GY861_15700 [bacterium]|nr:hypothetical protein [bacterium]